MLRRCARSPFENLKSFLHFWADDKPNTACCLFATDEQLETDPGEYDCQSCTVAEALDGLYPENRQAWSLYQTVMTRFAYETGTIPLWLDRLTRDLAPDAASEALMRCSLIFDEMNPVRPAKD